MLYDIQNQEFGQLLMDKMKSAVTEHDALYVVYRKTAWHIIKKIKASSSLSSQARMLMANNNRRFFTAQFLGIKMQFDIYSLTDFFILNDIRSHGLYEASTTKFIMDALKPGDRFIDVGANSGYYTLLASKMVGEKGKVYAFEPSPWQFKRLKHNIEINKLDNVVIFPKALWKEVTDLPFYLSDIQDGMDSLIPVSHESILMVNTATIDSIIPDEEIALIKIDVEGAEEKVCMGAKNMLRKKKIGNIIVEWNKFFHPTIRECNACFDYLENVGDIYHIKEASIGRGYLLRGPIKDRKRLPACCNLLLDTRLSKRRPDAYK